MRDYGLKLEARDPQAWNFGSGQLQSDILQIEGQWDEFLPTDEYQNTGLFEPYACASYGTLNCIETILRRRFSQVEDFSDRYLAKMTGTDQKHGNDPHYVAEFLRLQGDCFEKDWPSANVRTFEDYYEQPPQLPDKLLPQFSFGHDVVPSTPADMKSALRFSPLGASVYGWALDEDGLYYRPEGVSDNHWVCIYGYLDGQYWKAFDSYSNSHKKLKWDYPHALVKRYHIDRTVASQQQLSLLKQILKRVQLFLARYN